MQNYVKLALPAILGALGAIAAMALPAYHFAFCSGAFLPAASASVI